MITILYIFAAWINLSITIYCVYELRRYKRNVKAIVTGLNSLRLMNAFFKEDEGEANKDTINVNLIGFINQINRQFNL